MKLHTLLNRDCTRVFKNKHCVFSPSWQACVPHLSEGARPAVTGRGLSRNRSLSRSHALSRSRSLSRKPTQSLNPSLKTTLSPVAPPACRLQLPTPLGKMDPDRPLTALLLAASEIQVRPQQVCFY